MELQKLYRTDKERWRNSEAKISFKTMLKYFPNVWEDGVSSAEGLARVNAIRTRFPLDVRWRWDKVQREIQADFGSGVDGAAGLRAGGADGMQRKMRSWEGDQAGRRSADGKGTAPTALPPMPPRVLPCPLTLTIHERESADASATRHKMRYSEIQDTS